MKRFKIAILVALSMLINHCWSYRSGYFDRHNERPDKSKMIYQGGPGILYNEEGVEVGYLDSEASFHVFIESDLFEGTPLEEFMNNQ